MVLWAVLLVLAAGGMAYCGESDPSGRMKVGAETGSISAERTDKGSPGEPLKTLTEGGSVHEGKKEPDVRVSNPTIQKGKKPVSPQT